MFFLDPDADCDWCGLPGDHPVHDRERMLLSHPYGAPSESLIARRRPLPRGEHHHDYVVADSPFAERWRSSTDMCVPQGYPIVAACPMPGDHANELVGWRSLFNMAWAEPFLVGWLGGCGCQLFVSAWALSVTPTDSGQYASFVRLPPDSHLLS